ncbi:hypothetical protein BofuT4_P057390.1 [Botrytis cinerea T4]|uniref:Uncharacterized protein n=1 Tax=Botryotinia fuckeliana (strain T4) TaxID=999810 RepID=G2XUI9_BOTF4|nr:hypothetical protein BofuT4_P057390.1 [Botrytis cinerea T4]
MPLQASQVRLMAYMMRRLRISQFLWPETANDSSGFVPVGILGIPQAPQIQRSQWTVIHRNSDQFPETYQDELCHHIQVSRSYYVHSHRLMASHQPQILGTDAARPKDNFLCEQNPFRLRIEPLN